MDKGRQRYLEKKASTLDLGTDLLSMLHYGGFVQSKIYFRVLRS